MDLDRFLLLAFGLVFAGMSLLAPRALRTGRAGGARGVARDEDPPQFWFAVLVPPAVAVAALGYFAAGGAELARIAYPATLLVFGFTLVRALQTGRVRGWHATREEAPRAFRTMIALIAVPLALAAAAYAMLLLGA